MSCRCRPSFRDPYPDLCRSCEDEADGRTCPRCDEWFRSEDGVTSNESERVFLCRPCSQAEERDARMVGRGEEACAS